jgi:hypothetical protein
MLTYFFNKNNLVIRHCYDSSVLLKINQVLCSKALKRGKEKNVISKAAPKTTKTLGG